MDTQFTETTLNTLATEPGADFITDDVLVADPIMETQPATGTSPATTDSQESGSSQSPDLPDGFTEAPQDPEHMDLGKVKKYAKWIKIYRNVSDDKGDFLDDKKLELKAKKLCDDLASMDLKLEEAPQLWIDRITQLVREEYIPAVNRAENNSIGILTKYRIRHGLLLNFQKILVKKHLKKNWVVWFVETYGPRMLRSAQDYMRIAEVSNAIRYAVFGKERLLGIVKNLPETDVADPIGDFLLANGIEFDPNVEPDHEEIRVQADIAIARMSFNKNSLQEVPDDKLEAFIRGGNHVKPAIVEELKRVKAANNDLNRHMEILIERKGKTTKDEPSKAESYRKTLDKFLELTEEAMKDSIYLRAIDHDLYQRLKAKVLELEARFTDSASR
jgi:hypothetical protein